LRTKKAYIFWFILLLTKSNLCLAELSLSSNTFVSTEGYLVLNWESGLPQNTSLSLFRSANPAFDDPVLKTVPANGSMTVTGLENGSYYFQLRNPDDMLQSSNTINVEVSHHSLTRAFMFFSIGLVLFLILVAAIFAGERRKA